MNRTQLVDALAERLGDRRTAAAAVDGLLDTIIEEVKGGGSVSLTGFGVFESRARAARTARNPRTGEAIAVPATTVPAFRPGAAFRSAVGGGATPTPRRTPSRTRPAVTATRSDEAAADSGSAGAGEPERPRKGESAEGESAEGESAEGKSAKGKSAKGKSAKGKEKPAKAERAKKGKAKAKK